MNVSLKQIAQSLGVSVATVSRVVNGKSPVKDETRRKIEEALYQAGYSPNLIARSLKTRSTMTAGILVPDITETYFGNIIKSATKFLEAAGYGILLCDSDENPRRESFYLQYLLDKRVDGLILACVGEDLEQIRRLQNARIPVVLVDNQIPIQADAILLDNARAGSLGAEHLLARGYRRVGVIAGSQREHTGRARLQGCRNTFLQAGVECLVREGDFKEHSGYAAALSLLDESPRPDALFVHSSKMSYGAMKALRERGVNYPKEIGFLAFDLWDSYGSLNPSVSSIVQPESELGTEAARQLLARIEGGGTKKTLFMEPILLERESTGNGISNIK